MMTFCSRNMYIRIITIKTIVIMFTRARTVNVREIWSEISDGLANELMHNIHYVRYTHTWHTWSTCQFSQKANFHCFASCENMSSFLRIIVIMRCRSFNRNKLFIRFLHYWSLLNYWSFFSHRLSVFFINDHRTRSCMTVTSWHFIKWWHKIIFEQFPNINKNAI